MNSHDLKDEELASRERSNALNPELRREKSAEARQLIIASFELTKKASEKPIKFHVEPHPGAEVKDVSAEVEDESEGECPLCMERKKDTPVISFVKNKDGTKKQEIEYYCHPCVQRIITTARAQGKKPHAPNTRSTIIYTEAQANPLVRKIIDGTATIEDLTCLICMHVFNDPVAIVSKVENQYGQLEDHVTHCCRTCFDKHKGFALAAGRTVTDVVTQKPVKNLHEPPPTDRVVAEGALKLEIEMKAKDPSMPEIKSRQEDLPSPPPPMPPQPSENGCGKKGVGAGVLGLALVTGVAVVLMTGSKNNSETPSTPIPPAPPAPPFSFPKNYFFTPPLGSSALPTLGIKNEYPSEFSIKKIQFNLNARVKAVTFDWLPQDVSVTSVLSNNGTSYTTTITSTNTPIQVPGRAKKQFSFAADNILGNLGLVLVPSSVRMWANETWHDLVLNGTSSKPDPHPGYTMSCYLPRTEKYFAESDVFPSDHCNNVKIDPFNVLKNGTLVPFNTSEAAWVVPQAAMLKMRYPFMKVTVTLGGNGTEANFQNLMRNTTDGLRFAREASKLANGNPIDHVNIDTPVNTTNIANYTRLLRTVKNNLPASSQLGVHIPGKTPEINAFPKPLLCQLLQVPDSVIPWIIKINDPPPGGNADFPQPSDNWLSFQSGDTVLSSLRALNGTNCVKKVNLPITTACVVYQFANLNGGWGLGTSFLGKLDNFDYRCFDDRSCKPGISLPSDLNSAIYNVGALQEVERSFSANTIGYCEYYDSAADKVNLGRFFFGKGLDGATIINFPRDASSGVIIRGASSALPPKTTTQAADPHELAVQTFTPSSNFVEKLEKNMHSGFKMGFMCAAAQKCAKFYLDQHKQMSADKKYIILESTYMTAVFAATQDPFAVLTLPVIKRILIRMSFNPQDAIECASDLALMCSVLSSHPVVFAGGLTALRIGAEFTQLDLVVSACQFIVTRRMPYNEWSRETETECEKQLEHKELEHKELTDNSSAYRYAVIQMHHAYDMITETEYGRYCKNLFDSAEETLDTVIGLPMELVNDLLNAGADCVSGIFGSAKAKASGFAGMLKYGFLACRSRRTASPEEEQNLEAGSSNLAEP